MLAPCPWQPAVWRTARTATTERSVARRSRPSGMSQQTERGVPAIAVSVQHALAAGYFSAATSRRADPAAGP